MKTIHSKPAKPKGRPASSGTSRIEFWAVFLARAILVAASFALFLPIIVNGSFYYSFMFLKSILFRATVQLMVALYVALAMISPPYRPRFHLLSYALMAWFGVMLISSLPGISVDAWNSWWGDFRRMGGMVAQLHLLAFFVVLSQTFKRERDWLTVFVASLFAAVLMGFSGMLQYLQLDYLYRFPQESRIEGAAGNANFFAAAMMLSILVVLWLLARKDKGTAYPVLARVWLILLAGVDLFAVGWDICTGGHITSGLTLFPVAVFALALHGMSFGWFVLRRSIRAGEAVLVLIAGWCFFWMYQTQTRSAVVGLFGSLMCLAALYSFFGATRKARLACACLILLIILPPAVILINRSSPWITSHPILLRYASLSFSDASAVNRVYAWRASARAAAERPLFGWGLDNYRNAFDRHFPPEIHTAAGAEFWFDRAHNWVMDIGTTTGLAGLTIYAGFYGMVLLFLWQRWFQRRDQADTLLMMALVLAYLLQGLFTFDTVNTDIILYLVLAYVAYLHAGAATCPDVHPGDKSPPTRRSRRDWILVGSAAAILAAALSFSVIRPFKSNRLLQQARISTRALDPETRTPRVAYREETVGLFRRADAYQTTGQHAVHEEFANYAFDLAKASYIPIGQKIAAVKQAASFLNESIARSPANARHYQYMASLVNGTFDFVRKEDPQLATSLAELALAGLQKAEFLSPTRPQWYFEKSQLLFFLGRTDERVAAWERGLALCPDVKEPHVNLVTIYVLSDRYNDAAREWQSMRARGFPLDRADYDRVIGSYVAKKKLEPVVGLYKEQLAATPGDSELLAHLAMAYRDLGEADLARQTAIKAAALSPRLASGLQNFLDSLKASSPDEAASKVQAMKRAKASKL